MDDMIVAALRAAHFALDDSEEREEDGERVHILTAENFDALAAALQALDGLPESPNAVETGPIKVQRILAARNKSVRRTVLDLRARLVSEEATTHRALSALRYVAEHRVEPCEPEHMPDRQWLRFIGYRHLIEFVREQHKALAP